MGKRQLCTHCNRSKKTCLCKHVEIVSTPVKIIILQHPNESSHALNTANLAALCIPEIEIWVSDNFSTYEPLTELLKTGPYLLFPTETAENLDDIKENVILSKRTFLVLDGTWRKCRRIYYSTAGLQKLRCVQFLNPPTSNYRIRKTPGESALSTIESIAELLGILESDREKFKPLHHIFQKMVDQQIEFMGEAVYQKNYR